MKEELEFIQGLFDLNTSDINLYLLVVKVLLTSALCFLVAMVYVRFGNSLSNRKALSKNFVLIGLTTMIIITIVKSSLALSLGLVGALSIVRFRTAIKEPEELAYFFIVISIGLGIGAEQMWVSIIGTLATCLIIFLNNRKQAADINQNLLIKMPSAKEDQAQGLIDYLKSNCNSLELRRLDELDNQVELSFGVNFKNIEQLISTKNYLNKTYPGCSFSFLQKV